MIHPPARHGMVIAPVRGRIIGRPVPAPRERTQAAPGAGRGWQFPLMLLILMMFGQSFQYVNDFPPLYLLTKAWPLLMLPVAAWAVMRVDLPYRPLLLITLFWTMAITPFVGVVMLGNTIVGAIASTAKVWALGTGFAMAGLLACFRPDPATLRRGILWLGAISFAAFPLLWAVIPEQYYHRGIAETKLFLWDEDRGLRLYVPMFFGMLTLFFTARSCWERPQAWKLLLVAFFFLVMVTLYKQRMPILGAALVILIGAALSAGRWRTAALVGLGAMGALAAIPLSFYLRSDNVARQLGGSLTTRQAEIEAAIAFLDDRPLRWLIGAGSATRIGDTSLADIVGARLFFLADIGWLGVIFEYGAIGAAILLALLLSGLRLAWAAAKVGGPFAAALFDYILYFLISSPVTPVVFAPGELMFCMALAHYLRRRHAEEMPSPSLPTRIRFSSDRNRSW
ncbi:hypothetical protein CLG96_12550 [Sphingomonas oleivorans]|uniref:O-antigen ligase domain-containing protein n=1 Tax=Sphingomonas oleivorans TaxID=1735121 RepID=A0A2T5FW24_9SPHN|nr:hypothetical protein [Sphingomonas oleivorans]PTQ09975.1 hypothetical protein CLG96_12550 [Sphingomonas oleivorans]